MIKFTEQTLGIVGQSSQSGAVALEKKVDQLTAQQNKLSKEIDYWTEKYTFSRGEAQVLKEELQAQKAIIAQKDKEIQDLQAEVQKITSRESRLIQEVKTIGQAGLD